MTKARPTTVWGYLAGAAITGVATLANHLLMSYLSPANLIMVYLLGVVIVAVRFGRGASVLASFLSVAAFDFFFVHPYLTFAVTDTQYLLTFAMMLAVALLISTLTTQVLEHARAIDQASVQIETERLRSSLLSSISHDLRTPLATITGAATSLMQQGDGMDNSAQMELAQVIFEESERMNRLVGNLLEMTRLETGNLKVNKEWQAIEEVIGSSLSGFETRLAGRKVVVSLPQELILVPLDAVLIEHVLSNLLDNAIKYSDGEIEVRARREPHSVALSILDRGPGINSGESRQIFEKFARGAASQKIGGVGLGLAICEGIVKAHGGTITATNRADGGAEFTFTLPLQEVPPDLVAEELTVNRLSNDNQPRAQL